MYQTCENCGAYLDPGETCDCSERSDEKEEQNKMSLCGGTQEGSKAKILVTV